MKKFFCKKFNSEIKNQKPQPQVDQKSILICTPMYGGMGAGVYQRSLLQTMAYFSGKNIKIGWNTLQNESLIPRGRNTLTHIFLRSDFTHMMFIDADVGWNPEDVERMVNADVDVIGGICPKKEVNWQNVAQKMQPGMSAEELQHHGKAFVCTPIVPGMYAPDKMFEVKFIGSSFILISRVALDALKFEITYYVNNVKDLNGGIKIGELIGEYFSSSVDKETGELLSEDYFFVKLCRDNGIKVYAAPWAQLGHWGNYLF